MTAVLPDLDPATISELQPPCDAGKLPCWCTYCAGAVTGFHACDDPATEVVTARCSGGHGVSVTVIVCHGHGDEINDSMVGNCSVCGGRGIVERRPL